MVGCGREDGSDSWRVACEKVVCAADGED